MSLFFVLCVFVPFSTHLGELAVVPTCVLKKSAVFLDIFAVFPRVVFRVAPYRGDRNLAMFDFRFSSCFFRSRLGSNESVGVSLYSKPKLDT